MDRVIAVHGPPPTELEAAYEKSYLPFVTSLAEHPRLKFAFHFSGVVYDWLVARHPEFLDKLKTLVRRGQAEALTSGYYDPLLSLIPDEDKHGQIAWMNRFIKEKFGVPPRGIWLAEKDWESNFPALFSDLEVEYALVACPAAADGYYLTESHGKMLKLCPTSPLQPEQYPFLLPQEDLQWSVFEETVPRGRMYLAPDIYHRNLLVQDVAANNLHKKMLFVSSKLQAIKKGKMLFGEREREKQLEKAVSELYRGQGEVSYGPLIRAESEIEKFNRGGKDFVELAVTDFDKDGNDEVILSNHFLNLYFSPQQGGGLFEFDYKPKAVNLQKVGAPYSLLDYFSSPAHLDLADQAYAFMPQRRANEVGVKMTYAGLVGQAPVKLEKHVTMLAKFPGVHIDYCLTNQGKEAVEFDFHTCFNFSLPIVKSELGPGLNLVDEANGFAVSLQVDKPTFPNWKFVLGPSESWTIKMTLRIEE